MRRTSKSRRGIFRLTQIMLIALALLSLPENIEELDHLPTNRVNSYYSYNYKPLQVGPLIKLPITTFTPGGWIKKSLELQRDGLCGHLGEISVWLTKKDNAWLSKSGLGQYGWEEVPYWLRGYSRIAYLLRDPKMLAETRFWVEGVIGSQRDNGDFGPIHNHSGGFRDLWAQMLMLQVLQSWYEFSGDKRVITLMSRYFRWESKIPDSHFLKDYWENSRGGDNLASVYWLYNRTREGFLLDLATKIDRNTANWREVRGLPNLHNVNVAECFREPATYWLQSGNQKDLEASYRDFDLIRAEFGQVPGGMFGADENARAGHDDPHQAVETCGMVEQMESNMQMLTITGDPKWAANTENVAFNTFPAAFTADYRALRYLTAPNMALSDAKDHSPGLQNGGPFLLMNPFSSRCCQHNHGSGWPNYLESTWMATEDNGLAAVLFNQGTVTAQVGKGESVSITTTTHYPFESKVLMRIRSKHPVEFPLYLLIPAWADGATVHFSGHSSLQVEAGRYLRVERTWMSGDCLTINLPMKPVVKVWKKMKDSVSVDFGPLTLSLMIKEAYKPVDGKLNAIGDSGWQAGSDSSKWLTYEIDPMSPWNYGLASRIFTLVKRPWPKDDNPFTIAETPLEFFTEGKQIPTWSFDRYGLVGELPASPVLDSGPLARLVLVPMGAARLRISSFPMVK